MYMKVVTSGAERKIASRRSCFKPMRSIAQLTIILMKPEGSQWYLTSSSIFKHSQK